MKRKKLVRYLSLTAFAAWLLAALVPAAAQSEDAAPPPPPPGELMMHASGHGMVGFGPVTDEIGDGKVVKGAPMTGTMEMTRETTLADGTHIRNTNTTKIYRDSEGRVRREISLSLNTPTTGPLTRSMIVIMDPVAGHRYTLIPDNKTMRESPLGGSGPHHHPMPPGMAAHSEGGLHGDPGSFTTENLGTKTMDGLQVTGTRVTHTIPAGEIGNDKPIEVISERWFSTDLQVPVLILHQDPMIGNVTSKLTDVSRGEPDPSLFQVPAGYTVQTGRGGDVFYMPMHP